MNAGAPLALLGIGQVQHTRLRPARHAFRYPTYFLMLPMRALAAQTQGWGGVAHNRLGLVSFFDRDHGTGQGSALAWFESVLACEGLLAQADGEVWLHTYPRVAGYAFKPVSFWYAHRRDGSLLAALAEVNNTFGERHCYLLSGPDLAWGRELKANKVFHVSPFCAVAGDYRFRFLRTGRAPSSRSHRGARGASRCSRPPAADQRQRRPGTRDRCPRATRLLRHADDVAGRDLSNPLASAAVGR